MQKIAVCFILDSFRIFPCICNGIYNIPVGNKYFFRFDFRFVEKKVTRVNICIELDKIFSGNVLKINVFFIKNIFQAVVENNPYFFKII